MMILAAAAAAACLAAGPLGEEVDLAQIAARMQAAAGTAAAPGGGDLELTGHLEVAGATFALRLLVRREPFAYREELTWLAPPTAGDAPRPPPGFGRRSVFLSDGEHCWNLADDVGPAGAMSGWPAVGLLDHALLLRLLVDPVAMLAARPSNSPRVVTAGQARPGVDEEVVWLAWPHGTAWLARVERDSGRLTTLSDSTGTTGRWYRLDGWRAFTGDVTLPARVQAGAFDTTSVVIRIDDARRGMRHADAMFAGDPQQRTGPAEDVARLALLPHPVPGAGLLGLPGANVHGPTGSLEGVWALFDTGASDVYLAPYVPRLLGLPRIAAQRSAGSAGGGVGDVVFLDRVEVGSYRWLQLPAGVAPLPPINELPAANPAGLVLGGPRLMELSPVLDLHGGRLLLRAHPPRTAAVRPLSEVVGRTTLTVPLRDDGRGRPLLDVAIDGTPLTVLLDTGQPLTMRIARADLRRLHLPDDDESWIERGAVPGRMTGAFGHAGTELRVRLEHDVVLGPVTVRRPWVTLMASGLDAPDVAVRDTSQVGTGLLAPFDLVGFDWDRKRLELVPPPDLLAGGEDGAAPRAVVPPPADLLGFVLLSPEAGAASRPLSLPLVADVSEGSPAARGGLRAGDRLAAIGGMSCDGLAPMDLWPRLRPRAGTALELQVVRGAGDELVSIVLEP